MKTKGNISFKRQIEKFKEIEEVKTAIDYHVINCIEQTKKEKKKNDKKWSNN